MTHLLDGLPLWWIIPLLVGGGGIAAVAAIPGALAFVVGIWNASPLWLKAVLVGVTAGLILYAKGRHDADVAAREVERKRNAEAISNRETINHEVQNLDKPAADKRLERWMRKED